MQKTLIFIFFIKLSVTVLSQNSTISGFVHDKDTGEKLISAIIKNNSTDNSTVTNEYGFYSMDFNKETIISFSYIGYKTKTIKLRTVKDTTINIYLTEDNEINEVVISSKKNEINETEISTINIDIKQIKKLPSLGGETDIIRAIKILPGIQSGNEGTTGLYVRGGGADQNLFLLDGVPLYNISHLFGFMSVFNDDAINSMKVIKGGFPARYGGRLSSVIDIRMKEGNMNKLAGNVSVGLISSKLMIEAPIKKNKSSFLISARRTYVDAFTRAINLIKKDDGINQTNYYFYDITTKINYKFSNKNRIYLSLYLGNDNFTKKYNYSNNNITENDLSALSWGSKLASFRHNYLFTKKVFLNTSLYYSYYQLINKTSYSFSNKDNSLENEFFEMQYSSNITDFGLISDLDIYQSKNYHLKIGINGVRHNFLPGVKAINTKNSENGSESTASSGTNIYANEFRGYVENKLKIASRLKLNLGINASLFNVQKTNYHSLEPRASAIFIFSNKNSIKASYSQTQQYLHLLTNSGFGLPTDLWVPSTSKIAAQKAEQFAMGYYQKLPTNITFSIETYYKRMNNLISYKENSTYFIESKDWDSKVLTNGKGQSYGIELFLQKEIKKIQIYLGYTFSKTNRQFTELNNGKEYSYKYDRTHDVALSIIYKINKNIDVSANWIYGTGNAVSLPIAVYPSTLFPPSINNNTVEENNNPVPSSIDYRNKTEIFDYGNKNSQRLPAYHRLDINFSFYKKKKRGERIMKLGLYNAYNRRNPYYLTYAYDNDGFGNYNAKGEFRIVSLFPILPSISYSFKF